MSTLVHRFQSGAEVRVFPSGRTVSIDPGGRVTVLDGDALDMLDEAIYEDGLRYCSICDGIGHGYPGGGPCPLEERGYWEAEADRMRYGTY